MRDLLPNTCLCINDKPPGIKEIISYMNLYNFRFIASKILKSIRSTVINTANILLINQNINVVLFKYTERWKCKKGMEYKKLSLYK